MIIHVNKDNFEEEVLKSEIPVLADFWAERCPPCRMLAPIIEELGDELDGTVKVVKIDVDDDTNMEIAMKYGIQNIPTLILYKDGEVAKTAVGFKPKEQLLEWLNG